MTLTPYQTEKGAGWGLLCAPWLRVLCCWYGGCKGAVPCWSWSVCCQVCPSFSPCRYCYFAPSIWVTPPWVISHLAGFQSALSPGRYCPHKTLRLPGSSRSPSWRISSAVSYLRKPWVCTSLTVTMQQWVSSDSNPWSQPASNGTTSFTIIAPRRSRLFGVEIHWACCWHQPLEEEPKCQSVHWGGLILFQKCYESVSSVPLKHTTAYYVQVTAGSFLNRMKMDSDIYARK